MFISIFQMQITVCFYQEVKNVIEHARLSKKKETIYHVTIKNVVTTDRYDMNYVSTPQNVTRLEFLGGSDMRHTTKIARESENSSGNMTREV